MKERTNKKSPQFNLKNMGAITRAINDLDNTIAEELTRAINDLDNTIAEEKR